MMVPSRSRKTAGDSASVMFAVLSETGDKFVACHGRCSKFADDDCAGVVGNFRRFNRSRSADERKSKERDGGVAGAGNIENLPRFGRDVVRRLVLLKKHHAVFAERDEEIFCVPFLKQRFTGAPKIDIFRRSFVWIAPSNASGEEGFSAIWFDSSHAAPIDRMPRVGISRDDLAGRPRVAAQFGKPAQSLESLCHNLRK